MWIETTTASLQKKENIDKITQQVFKNCYAKRNITKTTIVQEKINEIDSLAWQIENTKYIYILEANKNKLTNYLESKFDLKEKTS